MGPPEGKKLMMKIDTVSQNRINADEKNHEIWRKF